MGDLPSDLRVSHMAYDAMMALASELRPRAPTADPFKFPSYLRGVIPDGQRLAMDEAAAEYVAMFDQSPSTHGLFAEGIGFFGYPYLAELAQRAEYRRAVEVIAEEMTRKWVKLKAIGDEDKTDKIDVLEKQLARWDLRSVFRQALELDGFFGHGIIFIDYGDADVARYPENRERLLHPLKLDPKWISQGAFRGFRTIDPTWIAPNRYESSNPLLPGYYKPATWFVMGNEIHASRLISFISRPMPDMLKPAYNFGGLALTQMMKPYVDNWLRTRQSVSDLVHSFTVFNLATEMEGLMHGGDGSDEVRRMKIFCALRDNLGILLTNKETETFSNVSAPLGTLDHLQAQALEQICAVIAVPLVKYTGVTPSGLNASADGEIRVFYDSIHARQEKSMSDQFQVCLEVIQMDVFGDIDTDIGFEWVHLWELDEQGAAQVRKTNADTDAVLVEIGAIDADEVRQRVAEEMNSPYAGLDMSEGAPGPPDQGMEGEGEEAPMQPGQRPPNQLSQRTPKGEPGGERGTLSARKANGATPPAEPRRQMAPQEKPA